MGRPSSSMCCIFRIRICVYKEATSCVWLYSKHQSMLISLSYHTQGLRCDQPSRITSKHFDRFPNSVRRDGETWASAYPTAGSLKFDRLFWFSKKSNWAPSATSFLRNLSYRTGARRSSKPQRSKMNYLFSREPNRANLFNPFLVSSHLITAGFPRPLIYSSVRKSRD